MARRWRRWNHAALYVTRREWRTSPARRKATARSRRRAAIRGRARPLWRAGSRRAAARKAKAHGAFADGSLLIVWLRASVGATHGSASGLRESRKTKETHARSAQGKAHDGENKGRSKRAARWSG
eukprot:6207848-Pleurochrysis_carterae.AAC.1